MMCLIRFCLASALLVVPARAEELNVVSDIAPVQSLVELVMHGAGTTDLIVTAGSSPHGFALRPSQARALQDADLVVWVGPQLTPWLDKAIETLAPSAQKLELLDGPGTHRLEFRDGDGEHDADHGGDPHSGTDPHAWLDPQNGRVWLGLIAENLAELDPENAALYRANALAGREELTKLQSEIATALVPMQGQPYVTFHDAYQYFEARFGLTPTGAVTASDATNPGPAGLAHLRDELARVGAVCAFSEPQFDPGLLQAATGRDDLKIIALDPMGSRQELGPALYTGLLRDMGRAFASCVDLQ